MKIIVKGIKVPEEGLGVNARGNCCNGTVGTDPK